MTQKQIVDLCVSLCYFHIPYIGNVLRVEDCARHGIRRKIHDYTHTETNQLGIGMSFVI